MSNGTGRKKRSVAIKNSWCVWAYYNNVILRPNMHTYVCSWNMSSTQQHMAYENISSAHFTEHQIKLQFRLKPVLHQRKHAKGKFQLHM